MLTFVSLVNVEDERWGRVRRIFLGRTEDRAIAAALQKTCAPISFERVYASSYREISELRLLLVGRTISRLIAGDLLINGASPLLGQPFERHDPDADGARHGDHEWDPAAEADRQKDHKRRPLLPSRDQL
jgi:hypothetical protein